MKNLLFVICLIGIFSCTGKKEYQLSSPDGEIQVRLTENEGRIEFFQLCQGDTVIGNSPIGLLVDSIDFTQNMTVAGFEKASFDETWETVNGKNKSVRNHYNEYKLKLQQKTENPLDYTLVVRCYNDGFAYRYIMEKPSEETIRIDQELTDLHFKNDFTYWAYNNEKPNIGPVKRSEAEISKVEIPMVLELKEGLYMAVHEAEIIRYAPFSLNAEGNGHTVRFNLEKTDDLQLLKTSWRTFIIGNKPGDLVESNLLVNLNEPCKIEDTSWIKPGKSLWDWRVWGYKAKDGFEYGLNTTSHKRMIDFAAGNNIQYLLIDADWYGPEFSDESDPTAAREGIDINECMAYSKEKGVGIILYLNDVGAKKFGLERVLKQFSDWGAVGVKYGFMQGSWEDKVRHTRKVVELCAKYKLMVDFHDHPVPPSGDRRTWPNLVTKEFCHAQADAKRSYFPETAVTSPFINMVAGPLDYTDGWFDLNNAHSRVRVFEEIPGTVAAEVAKLIVAYSGLMVLPDSPEAYLGKEDLFDCIRQMPAGFDSFKILDGKISQFISVAREAGDDWFVGSLTNREERILEIDFAFLPEGQNYQATFYGDAEETHFLDNKESYEIKTLQVSSGAKIKIRMVPGGGNAIYLKKI